LLVVGLNIDVDMLTVQNGELENYLRKSVQSKVPSDPNIWLQMRDNFEKIILTDHDFSEQHEIEYLLWQLHYKRIDEFRRNINAAGSAASQSGKNNVNAERIRRIKSAFRSFLSEASGFYHDLMLKIKSNYGLPLGYFSEGPESVGNPMKDDKKIAEVKKGLISCHRCLIYLGDLARYKSLHGDDDSASREYAAASSYYNEAASVYPSNGNPHHQVSSHCCMWSTIGLFSIHLSHDVCQLALFFSLRYWPLIQATRW
jgi:protein SMG7